MKRTKFSGVLDVIEVDDPDQIRALANDERIDRQFALHPTVNSLILKKTLSTLSYSGVRFPTMTPKGDTLRSKNQDALWDKCNLKAAALESGTESLTDLVHWVRGDDANIEPGILVQQAVGCLFSDQFKATRESWAAALTLDSAIRSKNFLKMFWWKITGKIDKAKRLLAGMVNNDLSGVHGTGVALHNIVASIRLMRTYYADEKLRRSLTPEEAVDKCLSPPPVVLRQAKAPGEVSGCPFSKYSLLLLKLGEGDKNKQSKDLIFMTGSWSRCPAEKWVPALLAGVWKRATA
jgi:hypothetical protein